jgi:hypothetical protein
LAAIREALIWCRREGIAGRQLTIITDSLGALHLLGDLTPPTQQDNLCLIRTLLTSLTLRIQNIDLQWVKGHIGWAAHDRVDNLTGLPQHQGCVTPISIMFLKALVSHQSTNKWKEDWAQNKTKELFDICHRNETDLSRLRAADVR